MDDSTLPQTLDLPNIESVRRAIELERRVSRASTRIEVREHIVVNADDRIHKLVVASDEPLAEDNVWMGGRVRHQLDDGGEGYPWVGEILFVDPMEHSIYVAVYGEPPCVGRARVYPHDYLQAPYDLLTVPRFHFLQTQFRKRLVATRGQSPPRVLRTDHEPSAWNASWGAVWGPPGTGKTYTLGRQVAALLSDPSERVLIVSTTNRATDAAALELARAVRDRGIRLDVVRRVGRVVRPDAFLPDFEKILPTRDPELLDELRAVQSALRTAKGEHRAELEQQRSQLMSRLPGLRQAMPDPSLRAVVSTLHAALRLVVHEDTVRRLENGEPPFTTVVIDEAGLVGRALVAVTALLAERRVVLVGDPQQLSPIARAARSMPRPVMDWVASSALAHLRVDGHGPEVQLLNEQRRMHPDIREAVSQLMYAGQLRDSEDVANRPCRLGPELSRLPRMIWYVLDEDPTITSIERSSGAAQGRSRVRKGTLKVLEALFGAHPRLAELDGLFISPYRAQARTARAWLAEKGAQGWRASTVHAEQGAQATVVVFDTVHASSSAWPQHEWQRLLNVGLSRAQHLCVLVATRDELGQPWMRSIRPHLAPRVLARGARGWQWRTVDAEVRQENLFAVQVGMSNLEEGPPEANTTLGAQIERRRQMRPLLSVEQRRLVDRKLSDPGPRLVRGVAGSGKTFVLAHWAVRALQGLAVERVVIVYANEALAPLLLEMLADAWEGLVGGGLPIARVRLLHIRKLLADLTRELGLPPTEDSYDFELQATQILEHGGLDRRFECVLIDETQDIGHAPLQVLLSMVRPLHDALPVMVFYDNAQNIYQRPPPKWSELGLDLKGRSDVMRESFRSTRPITEVALNVLDRILPLRGDPDFRELMRPHQGVPLLQVDEAGWWQARFCVVDGEQPTVELFESWDEEVEALCATVEHWLVEEQVRPGDIRILAPQKALVQDVARRLNDRVRAEVVERRTKGFAGTDHCIVVTTPHSFKGYDAEIVVVIAADRFVGGDRPLGSTLYVALTRARTVLRVTGCRRGNRILVDALEATRRTLSGGYPDRP
ncbi:MAG: AAA domain-containing protein [Myxococcota bacterium]